MPEPKNSVALDVQDRIAWLTLSRPQSLNVLSRVMLEQIDEAVDAIDASDEVRAVILHGIKTFSAGADIRELSGATPQSAASYAEIAHTLFNRIESNPRPFIAAISGHALGGGCELALACDIRIATPGAKLGQPEINLGLIPGFGATQRLPHLVGPGLGRELIMTGRVVSGEEAKRIGLVTHVSEEDSLLAAAEEMARIFAQKSPIALGLIKQLLRQNCGAEEALKRERKAFASCFGFSDAREGISAFLEKRRPEFRGE